MKIPPPTAFSIEKASIILRTKESFTIWCHDIVPHMPRIGRYTTGARIENHFLDLLELIYKAYYASMENKNIVIVESISKNDIIKYLIQIAFENKLIKEKEYLTLSNKLHEVGKILGGWKNSIEIKLNKKPPENGR